MKKLLYVALFALLSIIPVPSVQAATLTWTLENVVFDDGGTAIGSFGYDADTNTFSAINITTSVNAALGLGTTYGVPAGGSASVFDTIFAFPPSGQPRFTAVLAAAMTNLGGTIAGIFIGEVICLSNGCGGQLYLREAVTGSISASPVPIPAALPLLAAGISAMGFMGWRRKRKALA